MTLALVDLDQEQQQQDDMSVYTGKGGLAVLNKQGGLTLNSILRARHICKPLQQWCADIPGKCFPILPITFPVE